jgi:hypothetical protein
LEAKTMNTIVYFPHVFLHLCAFMLALGSMVMIVDELGRAPLAALRFPLRAFTPRGLSGQRAWATVSAAHPRFSQQRTPGPQLGLAA